MNMQRIAALLMAVAMLFILNGCSVVPEFGSAAGELPAGTSEWAEYQAPETDRVDRVIRIPFYMPDTSMRRLVARESHVTQSLSRSAAGQTAQSLLLTRAGNGTRAISPDTSITLYGANPVTVSGGLCTVNLSASALALSSQELYTAALCLTETLCCLDDIDHVAVLCADQAPGMDIMGNLPMGALTPDPGRYPDELWDQLNAMRAPLGSDPASANIQSRAGLYYPIEDGAIAVTREVAFPGQSPQQLTDRLLHELSSGEGPYGIPAMSVLNNILEGPAQSSDRIEGGRLITLRFREDWEELAVLAGIDPEALLTSVVLTVTGFVPSVPAIEILVDGSALTEAGRLNFPDGVLRRTSFTTRVYDMAVIYVRGDEQIRPVRRPVPGGQRRNPRVLLDAMMKGLAGDEPDRGLEAPMPDGLTGDDVIGVAIEDDMLVVNFSGRTEEIFKAFSAYEERYCVYAMVQTLTEAAHVKSVLFLFGGEAKQTVAGAIDWSGPFMPVPSLVSEAGAGR